MSKHTNVARWTKDTDLFKKKMLAFPICQDAHWFLIIVINPGVITVIKCMFYIKNTLYIYISLFQLPDECEERQEKEPLVVVLDSMGWRQDSAVEEILEYLAVEWNKNLSIDKSNSVFPFDGSEMETTTPKCPGQADSSSCGLFLIEYLTRIFEDVDKFCTKQNYMHIEYWTNYREMQKKRTAIASLLINLSKQQGRFEYLNFPNINLFPITESTKTSFVENEDLTYFNSYVKSAAETQTDISLCRHYKLS